MAISVQFDEERLPLEYTEMATGGPVFDTGIVGNPTGVQQRSIRRQDAIRSWDIQFEGMTPAQRNTLESFFINKYGGGIGFRFFAPGDNRWFNDVIATSTGTGTASYPLYRKYVGTYRTISRRIFKPNDSAVSIYFNGVLQNFTLGSNYWFDGVNGYIYFAAGSRPSNGVSIKLDGGSYDTPVVFASDFFNADDYGLFANLNSIRLIELLPVALGLT